MDKNKTLMQTFPSFRSAPASAPASESASASASASDPPKLLEAIKQSSSQSSSSSVRSLQLHFEGQTFKTVFVSTSLKEQGVSLKVVLRDDSGSIAEEDFKIWIAAVDGEFPVDDSDVFTGKKFHEYVIHERGGKWPILTGECVITLRKGVSDIVNVTFNDNSSWRRNGKFRLGAQVKGSLPTGVTVREAISEAFMVKERPAKFLQKSVIPALNDEVYRLRHIARDGSVHNRLKMASIYSVNDLLQLYVADAASLKKILSVSEKKFQSIVESVAPLCSNIKQPGHSTIPYEDTVVPLDYRSSCEHSEVTSCSASSNMLLDAAIPNSGITAEDNILPKQNSSRWNILSLVLRAISVLKDTVHVSRRGIRAEDKILFKQNSSRWNVLSSALRAISKMKTMVNESYERMMLYCLLFGDNYEFEREKIIQLWMAAGFLKVEPFEDMGDRIFNFLLDKHYILPLKTNNSRRTISFKLNFELVAGIIAGSKAITDFKVTMKEEGNVIANQYADFWHISVQSSSINQATFKSLQKVGMLRTLIFLNNSLLTVLASDFFSNFKFLTALDLSGSCLTEVPSSIQDVTELRYIDLSWTRISRLPQSLVYLQKLQTLRLAGCMDLFELPERMYELINIRHLDFDILGQLILMPTGIGQLTELRTLLAFIVDGEIIDGKKCCNIKELKYMNNLFGKFCISGLEHVSSHDVEEATLIDKKHLKYLELRWSDAIAFLDKEDHVRVLEGLKPNTSLEELKIVCFPGEFLPNWIEDSQCQNLVSVSLYKCEDCSNFPFLGRLPKLKNLEIFEMNAVKKIDQFCSGGLDYVAFPRLENLSIDGMYAVESITNGDFACLVTYYLNFFL